MDNQDKNNALELLQSERVGVVSTISADGKPQSALINYIIDGDFVVYFTTLVSTRKYVNLQKNKNVAFTVGTARPPRTIQMEGIAETVSDTEELINVAGKYTEVALDRNPYTPPITKLDTAPGLVVYKITPNWIRWSDFTKEKKEGQEVATIILDSRSQ